jgi:hypothetical protein
VNFTSREPYLPKRSSRRPLGKHLSRDDTSSNSTQTPLACYEALSPNSTGNERRRSAGRLA